MKSEIDTKTRRGTKLEVIKSIAEITEKLFADIDHYAKTAIQLTEAQFSLDQYKSDFFRDANMVDMNLLTEKPLKEIGTTEKLRDLAFSVNRAIRWPGTFTSTLREHEARIADQKLIVAKLVIEKDVCEKRIESYKLLMQYANIPYTV